MEINQNTILYFLLCPFNSIHTVGRYWSSIPTKVLSEFHCQLVDITLIYRLGRFKINTFWLFVLNGRHLFWFWISCIRNTLYHFTSVDHGYLVTVERVVSVVALLGLPWHKYFVKQACKEAALSFKLIGLGVTNRVAPFSSNLDFTLLAESRRYNIADPYCQSEQYD